MYDFTLCEKKPSFLAATREARARAKIQLVDIVRNAAKTNPNHAQWILERSWPDEYSRVSVERVEQIGEKTDENKMSLNIFYDTGGQGMEKLLAFPNAETDSPEVAREKQRHMVGQIAEAPVKEKISDAPPPKVVPKAFTGRIRPAWRDGK